MTWLNQCAMKTINDLINELQKLNPDQKNLPFVLYDTEHNQEFNSLGIDISDKTRIGLDLKF